MTETVDILVPKIKLGQRVRDISTGFEGIAITRIHQMGMGTRYSVQPQSDDPSKMKEANDIDEVILEVIDDGISNIAIPVTECPISLGDLVQDKISDFEGIVSTMSEQLNGCMMCIVTDKVLKGKEKDTGSYQLTVVATRLERIQEKAVVVAPKQTGGPSTKSVR